MIYKQTVFIWNEIQIFFISSFYGEYCIINLNTYVRVKLKQNISTYEHMLMNIYESRQYIAKKPNINATINIWICFYFVYDICTKLVPLTHPVRNKNCNSLSWFSNSIIYIRWHQVILKCIQAYFLCLLGITANNKFHIIVYVAL